MPSPPEYLPYDVFLSYSSLDRATVQEIAERLRADGLKVWFDQWELRPGDHIHARIEEGLERSRTLVLCMSAAAFGSDWTRLESGVFRFRDPLNKERRFIPIRLDDTPAPGSLAALLHVDWRVRPRDDAYRQLLDACRPGTAPAPRSPPSSSLEGVMSLGHTDIVRSIAFSPDGRRALSASDDNTVRLWNVESGQAIRVLEGHSARVLSVSVSPEGHRALSGSDDNTLRLWDLRSGQTMRVLEGHSASVLSAAFTPDGKRALSASNDKTIRLWDLNSGQATRVLQGHAEGVLSAAVSPDGRHALSASVDDTVRLWDLDSGQEIRIFQGHSDKVWSAVFSPDVLHVLSASADNTVRRWDLNSGRTIRVLRCNSATVWSVTFSPDARRALVASDDNAIRMWDLHYGWQFCVLKVIPTASGALFTVRTVATSYPLPQIRPCAYGTWAPAKQFVSSKVIQIRS